MARKRQSARRMRSMSAAKRRGIRRKKPRPKLRSTHKVRSEWFRDSAAYPFRDISAESVARERRRAKRVLASHAPAGRWRLIGPTNIGGRMTAIVCDPADPDVVWAGAAAGGVWHSRDAGHTWKPQWHR